MTATDEFLEWLNVQHHDAGVALHNGDPTLKIAAWSTEEPVTLFGAFWFEVTGPQQAKEAFLQLAGRFSDCTEYSYEVIAHGVSGDLAYTVGYERASMCVDGTPSHHHLRVTQLYRREGDVWRVVHRHADAAHPPRGIT